MHAGLVSSLVRRSARVSADRVQQSPDSRQQVPLMGGDRYDDLDLLPARLEAKVGTLAGADDRALGHPRNLRGD